MFLQQQQKIQTNPNVLSLFLITSDDFLWYPVVCDITVVIQGDFSKPTTRFDQTNVTTTMWTEQETKPVWLLMIDVKLEVTHSWTQQYEKSMQKYKEVYKVRKSTQLYAIVFFTVNKLHYTHSDWKFTFYTDYQKKVALQCTPLTL